MIDATLCRRNDQVCDAGGRLLHLDVVGLDGVVGHQVNARSDAEAGPHLRRSIGNREARVGGDRRRHERCERIDDL